MFADRNLPFDPKLDAPRVKIVTPEEKEEWIAEGEANKPVYPWWRKGINWLCGVEAMQDQREPVYTEEEAEELIEMKKQEMSIDESTRDKILVNVFCALTVALTIFICGFFA